MCAVFSLPLVIPYIRMRDNGSACLGYTLNMSGGVVFLPDKFNALIL